MVKKSLFAACVFNINDYFSKQDNQLIFEQFIFIEIINKFSYYLKSKND